MFRITEKVRGYAHGLTSGASFLKPPETETVDRLCTYFVQQRPLFAVFVGPLFAPRSVGGGGGGGGGGGIFAVLLGGKPFVFCITVPPRVYIDAVAPRFVFFPVPLVPVSVVSASAA
jgi:hypothetical protein